MNETEHKPRISRVRLTIGAIICFCLFFVWLLLLSGRLWVSMVASDSMAPTLRTGDRLIVKALDPESEIYRNMVVTFESPDDEGAPLVKRVVALPGDVVGVRDGVLHINDEILTAKEGVSLPSYPRDDFEFTIEPDAYFVLGDNRTFSHDSTVFGPISRDLIKGEVMYRYAPWSRAGAIE